MRSRSTCDISLHHESPMRGWVSISDEKPLHMRPRGLPLPLARMRVSISDEKPLHMRLSEGLSRVQSFQVSISDEKPLHMRLGTLYMPGEPVPEFQSQMRGSELIPNKRAV